jgi:hypothetical protein
VYGLDFVVPDTSTRFIGPQLIDLNGARAGCASSFDVHGDHRVQAAILRHIAGAAGKICAVSQSIAHPDQLTFDSDVIRSLIGHAAGIYGGSNCFVPLGDPQSHDSDAYVEMVAATIGIAYEHVDLRWDAHSDSLVVTLANGDRVNLADWRPLTPVWPYSFDQRHIPLSQCNVTNPLPFAIATSNKILYYALLAKRLPTAVPAFRQIGLWDVARGGAVACAQSFSDAELLVIKPACSLRGFGTVVLPRETLSLMACELGLESNEANLHMSANLLAAALLWGNAAELLAIAQHYVRSAPVFHPETQLPHACIHRATVLCSDDKPPTCIDVNVVLAPESLMGPQTRDSLVISGSSARRIISPTNQDRERVAKAAETVVRCFEEEALAFFENCDARGMLLREADFLASQIDMHSDVAFAEVWSGFRSEVTLREVMEEHCNKLTSRAGALELSKNESA